MSKISLEPVKRLPKTLKANWNENQREGYELSIKSFLGISIASMGTESAERVMNYLAMSANSAVIGLVFGLSIQATYVIMSISMVLNLLFVPIISNVTDNMGMINSKTRKNINLGGIGALFACILLYITPSTMFDFIITDFFKHIALTIFVKYVSIYMYIYVYKFFGKKYGKYKPMIILLGVPSILMATIMVFLPYQNMRPQNLLLAVSFLSAAMSVFSAPYTASYEKMQNLLTRNSDERTLLLSVSPILVGLLRSLISIFLPLVATITGYEVNSIQVYRFVIPVFGTFSVAMSMFIFWAKEQIRYIPESREKANTTKQTAKEVFSNKYLWITMLSKSFDKVSAFDLVLLEWVLLYSIRQQWLIGPLMAITALPSTLGNLMTPFLAKKFANNKLMVFMQTTQIIVVLCSIPFLFSNNNIVIMVGLTFIGVMTTLTNTPKAILKKTSKAQALDYHQWRFGGKRVDESAELFSFISTPLLIITGYLSPFCMGLVGFINDRDVLYDSSISRNVFILLVVLYVLELLGSAIPYWFFDLDKKKVDQIHADLLQRSKEQKELEMQSEQLVSVASNVSETENE